MSQPFQLIVEISTITPIGPPFQSTIFDHNQYEPILKLPTQSVQN